MDDFFRLTRRRAPTLFFLLPALSFLALPAAAAGAEQVSPGDFSPGGGADLGKGWEGFTQGWLALGDWKFLLKLLAALVVAVGLAASIAYHPKSAEKVSNLEQLDQPHTFLMYAVVGVIVANLVVAMPAMAFVVFGIGGLLRFRTDVGPARNTGKVILVTLVGLACGLSQFALALLGTAFAWALIYVLESKVAFRVVVNWVGPDRLQQATQAYKDLLISSGFQLLSEQKNFAKAKASFIFRTPTKVSREELEKLFSQIPKELQGSLDWETT